MAFESARASKLSLINEVKKAYYTLLFARESYEVLQKNYDNIVLTYNNVLSKYNQGMASELEIACRSANEKSTAGLLSAKSNLELATMMLKVMIGLNIDEAVIFDGKLSDYEQLLKNNAVPDVDSLSLTNNSQLANCF